jgi:hypothetical protein
MHFHSASHRSKGPPEHATNLGQRQAMHMSHQGPPASHSEKAEVGWWPGWFGQTRTKATNLPLPHGASLLDLKVGSRWLLLFFRP